MDSLIFAVNAVGPIMIMIAIGYILKKIGMLNAEFAKKANTLVFRALLPVMLFLNIYKIESFGAIDLSYILYGVVTLVILFFAFIPIIIKLVPKKSRRGVLMQGTVRSNYALIGLPLAQSLFGEGGVATAAILSAFSIPIFNILGVACLAMNTDDEEHARIDIKKITLDILKNPLILGVCAGLLALIVRELFALADIGVRLSDAELVMKVLEYLSNTATPLALLTLGAQFEFSAISSLRREIILGTVLKVVIVPVIGIGVAYLFFRDSFGGAAFATFVALYATPVAVSTVPMAQEMNADAELAGQLVVFTTLFSSITIFMSALLLKLAGIF